MKNRNFDNRVITREFLNRNHLGVVHAIQYDAAKKASLAERDRIKAILNVPFANLYDDVIKAAIENGDTPDQVAASILAEEGKMPCMTY